ncbi:MAG: MtrB/PioB family outer membrane beta-barrel protein, partial [Acidobacteriota bacterium]
MTHLRRVLFGILAGILILSAPPVLAQDADDGVEGEVTAGPQYRADDRPGGSAKFEEFRDVPGGFVAERFIFSYRPKEGYVLDLKAWDMTQKDQRFSLEFGKQDRFRAYFTWAENPRRWTDRAKMLYADRGNGVFTLNDGLQSAVQAAAASADVLAPSGEWAPMPKGSR